MIWQLGFLQFGKTWLLACLSLDTILIRICSECPVVDCSSLQQNAPIFATVRLKIKTKSCFALGIVLLLAQ